MVAIAKGLGGAEAAAAPPIHFVMNLRVFYSVWAHFGADWLYLLTCHFCVQIVFDISVVLNIQVVEIFVLEGHIGIFWFLHPAFSLHVLQLADEVSLDGYQIFHTY